MGDIVLAREEPKAKAARKRAGKVAGKTMPTDRVTKTFWGIAEIC